MSDCDHCQECGRPLHNVFWCRACGDSCCSFTCLQRHRAEHAPKQPGDRPTNGEPQALR